MEINTSQTDLFRQAWEMPEIVERMAALQLG